MKKLFLAVVLFTTILAGCSSPKNLANMTMTLDIRTSINYIAWDDREYAPFGIGVEHLMGKQIGIIDGDKNDRVYAVNGYSSDEWIIEKYHTGEMDVAMLYKEKSIENIPLELQQYKIHPDQRTEAAKRMIESDGRKIIEPGTMAYNFTLTSGQFHQITSRVTGAYGSMPYNNYSDYIGYTIDVWTYLTLPTDIDASEYDTSGDEWKHYLFVFSGNKLIFNTRLETPEQSTFVHRLIGEVIGMGG